MLSTLGYSCLRAAGIPALSRRLGSGGTILCYHDVVRPRHGVPLGDPALHLPAAELEAQLRRLVRRYSIVPLEEFAARVASGKDTRRLVALTFDDGYRGVIDHALPILRDLRLPSTLFVVPGAVGTREPFWWDRPTIVREADPGRRFTWLHDLRGDGAEITVATGALHEGPAAKELLPAGWEELRRAADGGMTIGAHSVTHRVLTRLSAAELEDEVVESRALIERHLGVRPTFFAYPYGLWDDGVRAAVRDAGYAAAVTLDVGRNPAGTDPFALRRVNIPSSLTPAAFDCWVAGVSLARLAS